MPTTLKQKFTERMEQIYKDAASQIDYKANYFLRKVRKDKGVNAAKYYLRPDADVTDGFRRLLDNDRLDLSVEAVVLNEPQWHPLFTPSELETARSRLAQYGYSSRAQLPPHRNVDIMPEELDPAFQYPEGAKKQITVNAFERNPDARRDCVARYGAKCYVCDFRFDEFYGQLGDGYIHVHHLIQLAVAGGQVETDPVKHLRPVCPNCHAMLHTKSPPLTIGELQRIIKRNAKVGPTRKPRSSRRSDKPSGKKRVRSSRSAI